MVPSLRRRVLDTALLLIEEQGVGSLSMREVARRAGVSHQAPYRHFPDREGILAALQEEGFRELADALEAAEHAAGEAGAPEVGEAYVRHALAHAAHYRLLFRPDLVDPARFPEVRAQGDRAFGVLRRLAAPLVGPDAPEEVVVARLWASVHGLVDLVLAGALPVRGATLPVPALARGVLRAASPPRGSG